MTTTTETTHWEAKPLYARLIRLFALLAPIAASTLFVHLASKALAAPQGSFWLYAVWWIGLSGAATIVLILIDRVCRRLLPLAALLRLSLVFPDQAPSRFRAAMGNGTTKDLEQRIADARTGRPGETPLEAAERLLGLVAALDVHDRLTRGHSERVRAYSQLIGSELGLSKDEVDRLNWSALLHDVGKLGVDTAILTKAGKPDDDEWQALRGHPLLGEEMVAPLRAWLGEWADAVGHHHERWDGKGYPRGLAGEDISFAGRIVAVADVFDVMTSARTYKSAGGAVEARQELARCAETQFDPRVVRAFLAISLGRLRVAMGPLSWLAHAPLLGRIPLTPAIGAVSGTVAAATAAVATGLVAPPPDLTAPLRAPAALAAAAPDHRSPTAPTTPDVPPAAGAPAPPPAVHASPPAPAVSPPPGAPQDPAPPAPVDNRAPVPADDTASTAEDEPVAVDVLANDVDADGDLLQVTGVESLSAGTASITGGRVEWAPPRDFHGDASFAYGVADAHGGTATAHVNISVGPVNDVPVAAADSAVTAEETLVPILVLDNDSDPDGDELQLESVTQPATGTAQVSGSAVVYAPPKNFTGRARFSYRLGDRRGGFATGTVEVVVSGVNDPPVAVDDSASVVEGGSVDVDVVANDVDADGEALRLVGVGTPGAGSAQIVDGRVRYTAADEVGPVAFGYTVADQAGTTATGTLTVEVDSVNDPPTFTAGGARAVLEDAGATTVAGWATGIGAGPSDEAGQSVSFLVTSDDPGLFSAGPAVAADGTLTFTPAPNANGTATVTVRARDDGGTASGGVDISSPQTFTITVEAVNDAPSFTAGADVTLLESDSLLQVAQAGWATGISPGPADEAGQSVGFVVSSDLPGLFSVAPAVAPDGTLTFTPAAGANGVATVTVKAKDDGGTADGGVEKSAPQTFTITIAAVNSAPSFTPGGARTVLEDAGAQSVAGWATAISAGPPDESGQSLSFLVSSDNPTLFSAAPAVAADGTLTFTPAPDANGTATVTVRARDDGGTVNGGADTSAPETFTITVTAVNDAPSFAAGGNQTVAEDAGAQSVAGWASAIDAGPGESSQLVSFLVSSDDPGLFAAGPAVAADGTLSFAPAANASGSATVTVKARDDGGTADGGVDASPAATFTITVTAVQDPPLALDDAASTDEEAPVTFDVLANDSDADGDSLSVGSVDSSGIANGTLTPNGGGSYTYLPNSGFVGVETFTYTVSDGAGGTDSATAAISVNDVPHAPDAVDDAYTTDPDSSLTVAAPGLLDNDSDHDGDALSVATTPVTPPANGVATLAADGGFTYVPAPGFTGNDTFGYRIDDGTGSSDVAMVTIVVSATVTSSRLYLQSSGADANTYDMAATAPPSTGGSIPDWDGDGDPGLYIKSSGGGENESDPLKWHDWTSPAPAAVDGPVTLHLDAAVAFLALNKDVHPHVYLYDCDGGLTSCTRILAADVHVDSWAGLLGTWAAHDVPLGALTHTFAPGRVLRMRLLVGHNDVWVALTGERPSWLELTLP